MSTRTGRGIMVTLLLVTGCGSEYAARDNQGGGTTGNAGAAGTGAGGDGSDGTGTAGDPSFASRAHRPVRRNIASPG